MKIGIVGLGFVGLSLTSVLSSKGYDVVGIDVDIDKCKIINSHPAYLPYVRGLDSYKWAIYYGKPIGVTSHIISEEADSGYLIKKALVPIYNWDTFHSLALRQYELEIDLLVDSIEDIKTATLFKKKKSTFEPDFCANKLADNPWIVQPFEIYEELRIEEIRKKHQI